MGTIKIIKNIIFVILMSGVFSESIFGYKTSQEKKKYLYATDMAGYRNFYSIDSSILLKKNSHGTIFFEGENKELFFKNLKEYYIFELVKYNKKNIVHIFLKKNKNSKKYQIGYYSIPIKKYFSFGEKFKIDEKKCSQSIKNDVNNILDNKIVNKIKSLSLSEYLDKSSCDKFDSGDVSDFMDLLQDEVNSTQSSLLKCLNSSKVLNLTIQSSWLQYTISKSIFNIKNLFETMSSSSIEGKPLDKKFKIYCEVDDPNSNATSESNSDGIFSIKINFKKMYNENSYKDSQEFIKSIQHEFLHYKSSQFSMKNNCLDENYVSYVMSVCFGDQIDNSDITGDSIFKECAKNSKYLIGQNVAEGTFKEGIGSVAELIRIQQQVDSDTSEALRSTLQNVPDIQIPSEQQLENLAKMPLTNHNGQTIAANGNSEKVILPESAANVLENMSSGFGQMADSLNKAYLAAITPKSANASVVAATSQSKVSSGGVQASGEAANSNAVAAAYTLPEILADSGLISNETAAQLAKKSGDAASSKQVSAVAVNQQLDEKPTKSVAKTESTNPTSKGAVVKQVSSPGSVGTSSVVEQQASVAQADLIPNKRGIASVPTVQPTQNINVSDNKVLQTLSAYKRLSGNQYKDIQKMYTQQDFDRLLKSRGISILIKKDSNNQIVIGAQSKAVLSFVDDGQSLTRNEKKGPNE